MLTVFAKTNHNSQIQQKISRTLSFFSHFFTLHIDIFSIFHQHFFKFHASARWIRDLYVLVKFCLQVLDQESSRSQLSKSSFIHGSPDLLRFEALLSHSEASSHLPSCCRSSVSADPDSTRTVSHCSIDKVKDSIITISKIVLWLL